MGQDNKILKDKLMLMCYQQKCYNKSFYAYDILFIKTVINEGFDVDSVN